MMITSDSWNHAYLYVFLLMIAAKTLAEANIQKSKNIVTKRSVAGQRYSKESCDSLVMLYDIYEEMLESSSKLVDITTSLHFQNERLDNLLMNSNQSIPNALDVTKASPQEIRYVEESTKHEIEKYKTIKGKYSDLWKYFSKNMKAIIDNEEEQPKQSCNSEQLCSKSKWIRGCMECMPDVNGKASDKCKGLLKKKKNQKSFPHLSKMVIPAATNQRTTPESLHTRMIPFFQFKEAIQKTLTQKSILGKFNTTEDNINAWRRTALIFSVEVYVKLNKFICQATKEPSLQQELIPAYLRCNDTTTTTTTTVVPFTYGSPSSEISTDRTSSSSYPTTTSPSSETTTEGSSSNYYPTKTSSSLETTTEGSSSSFYATTSSPSLEVTTVGSSPSSYLTTNKITTNEPSTSSSYTNISRYTITDKTSTRTNYSNSSTTANSTNVASINGSTTTGTVPSSESCKNASEEIVKTLDKLNSDLHDLQIEISKTSEMLKNCIENKASITHILELTNELQTLLDRFQTISNIILGSHSKEIRLFSSSLLESIDKVKRLLSLPSQGDEIVCSRTSSGIIRALQALDSVIGEVEPDDLNKELYNKFYCHSKELSTSVLQVLKNKTKLSKDQQEEISELTRNIIGNTSTKITETGKKENERLNSLYHTVEDKFQQLKRRKEMLEKEIVSKKKQLIELRVTIPEK